MAKALYMPTMSFGSIRCDAAAAAAPAASPHHPLVFQGANEALEEEGTAASAGEADGLNGVRVEYM